MKFFKWLFPTKDVWRMTFLMLPIIIIGHWSYKSEPVDYKFFIIIAMLTYIWLEVLELKEELKK